MSDVAHKKVLVIEDDPLMSRMYHRVLTFEGFDVQLAENGQVGLEKLKDFAPDIILLDMMMPVLNGKDTLARLKGDSATIDILVIMLSNLTDPKTADEMVQAGALQYIVKSKYSPTDVAELLRDVLAQRGTQPATTGAE